MMKKVLVLLAGALLLAAPAIAEEVPQGTVPAPAYNCDYQPSCEVAPGYYGAMGSSVKSKFNLSIGGFVRMDYAYNSQNLGTNGFFLPGPPAAGVPVSGSAKYAQDQSAFTARISRFWLKAAGPDFLGAKTGSLIEADFLGSATSSANTPASINENGVVRMRLAYATLDWANTQVLFGQYWDMFGPAIASTIDFRQAAGYGTPNNPRVAQFRLTQKVNFNSDNYLKLVAGVQNPVEDATNEIGGSVPNVAGQIMYVSKALGVAPGTFGLSMNNLQTGVFGLWGNQKGTAATASRSADVYGYGYYAFVPLVKSKDGKNRAMTASLEAQAYVAAGMNWNGATASTGAITATDVSYSNQLPNGSANKGYGAYGQVIFYPIQDLGITAGYARRNALDYASYGSTVFETYNSIVYGNAAYDLNAAVRVSAEYLHVTTQFNKSSNPSEGLGSFGQVNGVRVAAYYFF